MNKTIKTVLVILFLVLFFVINFWPHNYLSHDSYYYLRLAQEVEAGTLKNDVLSIDVLRNYPEQNTIKNNDYFTQFFELFSKFLPNVNLLTRAKIFVASIIISTTFFVGLTIFVLSKNTMLSFIGVLLFASHPLIKFYASFDTQITRMLLFVIILLSVASFLVFVQQNKKRFWIAITATCMIALLNVPNFSWFFNTVSSLSQYSFVSELRPPLLSDLLLVYPGLWFMFLFLLGIFYFFSQSYKDTFQKSEMFILVLTFFAGLFFLIEGLMMKRLLYFFIPLATIFVCSVYGIIIRSKSVQETVMDAGKFNLFYALSIFVLIIFGLFVPKYPLVFEEHFSDFDSLKAFENHDKIVLLSRWDWGYYLQYKTGLPTFWDGGMFQSMDARYWIKTFLYENETTSINNIRAFEEKYGVKIYFVIDKNFANSIAITLGMPRSENSVLNQFSTRPETLMSFERVFVSANNFFEVWRTK